MSSRGTVLAALLPRLRWEWRECNIYVTFYRLTILYYNTVNIQRELFSLYPRLCDSCKIYIHLITINILHFPLPKRDAEYIIIEQHLWKSSDTRNGTKKYPLPEIYV